jgi:tetratricopeptide (TPR) repeat protein
VELYRPQLHGLLFVASNAPLDALDGVGRTLREAPDDIGRFGIHALEDFASAWTLDEAGVRALLDESVANTDDDNRLAARSAQLGDASLSLQAARDLFDPLDPLVRAPALRLVPLIRSLTAHGAGERATDLARGYEGAVEEIGLGWVELGAFRSGRAARHFQRALELDPGNRDALEGLISAQRTVLVAGEEVPGLEPGSLDADLTALIDAWRRAREKDWRGVAELDELLASISPGEALFELAARVRIEWRLAAPDAERAAQALVIAETLLLRNWVPFDALLHAEAAIAAGRIEPAMGSFVNVANRILLAPLARTPQARILAERALEVARALPEEQQAEVRAWFRADAQPGAQREG